MSNRDYTIKQEQIARFAKAMGHPARIAILQFLAKQESFLIIVNLNQKHILYTKLFSNQHLISANSATFFIKSSNVQEGALPPFDFISNRAVSLFHFNLTL